MVARVVHLKALLRSIAHEITNFLGCKNGNKGGEYSKLRKGQYGNSCSLDIICSSQHFVSFRRIAVKKHLHKASVKGTTRKDVHYGKFSDDLITIGPQYVLVTTAYLPWQIKCREMFKPLKYQFIF